MRLRQLGAKRSPAKPEWGRNDLDGYGRTLVRVAAEQLDETAKKRKQRY